jgi:crotonobetainyl-CoA:carnitine CoA-transferase CaiB-like acyl-CoA transferase
MRRVALAALAAFSMGACRSYDNYSPMADQKGLIPAEQFAHYGRQQAEVVAIGRALAEWRTTSDEAGAAEQTDRAACFARRFPDVESVVADPHGHRLTVKFTTGWRVGILPIPGSLAPEATPGISPPGPSPCT